MTIAITTHGYSHMTLTTLIWWNVPPTDMMYPTFLGKWVGKIPFPPGTLNFTVLACQGVIAKVNNNAVVNSWHTQQLTEFSVNLSIFFVHARF